MYALRLLLAVLLCASFAAIKGAGKEGQGKYLSTDLTAIARVLKISTLAQRRTEWFSRSSESRQLGIRGLFSHRGAKGPDDKATFSVEDYFRFIITVATDVDRCGGPASVLQELFSKEYAPKATEGLMHFLVHAPKPTTVAGFQTYMERFHLGTEGKKKS